LAFFGGLAGSILAAFTPVDTGVTATATLPHSLLDRTESVEALCSVCAPLRTGPKPRVKTGLFSIARKRCRKRNVLCFQFAVVFPSWTSRVRVPSPAPFFNNLGIPTKPVTPCHSIRQPSLQIRVFRLPLRVALNRTSCTHPD
jgi:hypothetical protein